PHIRQLDESSLATHGRTIHLGHERTSPAYLAMSALPLKADRTGIVRLFVQEYRERRKKPQPLTTGASWQSGSKLGFVSSRSASRRAEHFLVTLLPSKWLLLFAKHLLFEANRTGDCSPAHAMPNSGRGDNRNCHVALISKMHWHKWVVLIAGSAGSALRAVRPPNLHITPIVGAISVTPQVRRVLCSDHPWPSWPTPFLQSCWRARSR